MQKYQSLFILIILLMTSWIFFQPAQAEGVAACSSGTVSGTIVGVDEATGTVTVDTGGGVTCTVTLNGNTDHSIASLLGEYFGDISQTSLTEALNATQGCAQVSSGSGAWSSCDAPGATPVQALYANPDGTFTARIINQDGSISTIVLTVEDVAAMENLNQMLAKLTVNWTIDETGDLVQVSDQVMAYHEAGVGFGVLVKLYSLSNASGIPVADLLAQFQAGEGIGDLFKAYGGKPAETGVGHVKQTVNTQTTQTNNGNHYGQNNQTNNGDNGSDHANNGNAIGKDKPKKPKK